MTIKTHVVNKTVQDVIIDDIFCNRCEKSMSDGGNYHGLRAVVSCDYGSKLGDMNKWAFDVCEGCLEEIWATFKMQPKNLAMQPCTGTIAGEPCEGEDHPFVYRGLCARVDHDVAKDITNDNNE